MQPYRYCKPPNGHIFGALSVVCLASAKEKCYMSSLVFVFRPQGVLRLFRRMARKKIGGEKEEEDKIHDLWEEGG